MDINQPELDLFQRNYIAGKNQLLFHTFAADVHTPISALIKLKDENYTFLFESVEKGSQKGRYSVIGLKPDLIWECKNNICKFKNLNISPKSVTLKTNPLDSLKDLFNNNNLRLPNVIPSISSGFLDTWVMK